MAKLLLVEDNEMNRDMLTRRLQRRGYEIITAVNGHEAVASAGAHSPDLILMDMSLPILDGWQATRVIKGATGTRDIPVIALTAHALREDREQALAAGCDEFETKPVDLEVLIRKVELLLTRPLSAQ
jgi:CheY-like chemotaxis protein